MGQGDVIADGDAGGGAGRRLALLHRGGARAGRRRRRADARAGRPRTGEGAGGAMSWQVRAYAALALVLAAGLRAGTSGAGRRRGSWRWWRRMAALAVVGRLAFAAVPNVKPTTDIVLFAGFALGAVPGFMVGAVTARGVEHVLRPGPVDGRGRWWRGAASAWRGRPGPALARPRASRWVAGARLRAGRPGLRRRSWTSTSRPSPPSRPPAPTARCPVPRCPTTWPTWSATSASAC